jgi:hypothetical protein
MKSILLVALSVSLCTVLLGLWVLSYFSYGLLAYEAYSGVGTELASLRGVVVFYHFDSYTDVRPRQSWGFGFQDPSSREGQRMEADFNVWNSPHWWNRSGVGFVSTDTAFTGHTKVLLVSIPYWLCFSFASLATFMVFRRRRRSKQQAKCEEAKVPGTASRFGS